ncbi:MAG TPA: histidine phosphatase family protein [Ktedonobacterales bacterium]
MTDQSDAIIETAEEAAEPDTFLSLKAGSTEIYFVRHGDALPGQDEVVLGDYDAQALSELGRQQALALATRMAFYKPTAVYSSPTGRAVQTARATADALGLTVTIDDDLCEVELGPIGGDLNTTDPAEVSKLLRLRLREIAHIAVSGGRWSAIPGSEPTEHLRARITSAVGRIHQRHPGERVAIFSHGGAINAFFADLLGLDRDYFFPAANTSVSVARVQGERRLLMALNDISHLREAGVLDASVRPPGE